MSLVRIIAGIFNDIHSNRSLGLFRDSVDRYSKILQAIRQGHVDL
jgi:hypothetical protein